MNLFSKLRKGLVNRTSIEKLNVLKVKSPRMSTLFQSRTDLVECSVYIVIVPTLITTVIHGGGVVVLRLGRYRGRPKRTGRINRGQTVLQGTVVVVHNIVLC